MNNSEIFTSAHKAAKRFFNMKMNKKYNYSVMFSFFLTEAYAKAKAAKEAVESFNKAILKETEKALLLSVILTKEVKKINNNFEKVTGTVTEKSEAWFPKSVINNGTVAKWFIQENYGYNTQISF